MTYHIINKFFPFLALLLFFSINPIEIQAQNPQDCVGAIPICLSGYSEENAYLGTGDIPNEINNGSSCLGTGEKNCVWYTFTTPFSGELCFSITPNTLSDDYDWAVYDLTDNSCEDIFGTAALELGCNYSGEGGVTGPNGLGGSMNEPCIQVVENGSYVINVSQFEDLSQDGYTIDFSDSSIDIFDELPPSIQGISADPDDESVPIECNANLVYITMSENVICENFDETAVTLTSGSSVHTVTDVLGETCEQFDGTTYSRVFAILFEPPITVGGLYTLTISSPDGAPTVVDLCENIIDTAIPADLSFPFFVSIANFEGDLEDIALCEGSGTILSIGNPDPNSTYNWYPNQIIDDSELLITGTTFIVGAGTFTISEPLDLYIAETKSNGCVSEPIQVTVSAHPIPVPDFDFVIDCETLGVQFTNQTAANVTAPDLTYTWFFGDPNLSGAAIEDPAFTYPLAGTYEVTLEATYGPNCDVETITKTVAFPEPPQADFSPILGECLSVSVAANVTADEFAWDWGDGSSGTTGTNADHTYSEPGTYTITLTTGLNHPECTLYNNIEESVTVSPEATSSDFTKSNDGCIPVTITVETDGTLDQYSWDWGDGSPNEEGATGTHTYLEDGVYEITLIATKSLDGCIATDTIKQTVEAFDNPSIQEIFIDPAEEPFATQNILFDYMTNDTRPMSHVWDFGDGTSSTEQNPLHSYDIKGDYTYCLTISTVEEGCVSEIICNQLTVITNARIDIPTAFSPNNDNLNDVLMVEGQGIQDFNFRLFNRWGEAVFETNDQTIGWDGNIDGKPQEMDVYLYTLEAVLVGGDVIVEEGTISLLR